MTKSTSSRAIKFLVILVVVLVILGALAEFGVRHMIRSSFRDDVMHHAQEAGVENPEEPNISFGASPVLFSLITKKVPHVDMTTPDTSQVSWPGGPNDLPEIKGQPSSAVTLDSVDISNSEAPIAEHLRISTTLGDDYLKAVLQQSMAGGGSQDDYAEDVIQSLFRITGVTSNAEEGTITIEFTGGATSMTLKPFAQNGRLAFEITRSSIFGLNLSEDVNRVIGEDLSEGFAESAQEGLRIEDAAVTADGLQLTMSGQNVNLHDISGAAAPAASASSAA
ncbi:DUF2993 domain-containing protein [Corynebacterium uropygiale]|uniref:DUF2993 domain-containing protein n=1 Tax=Corynebacterium uropygiale TaxID=1775911 RepID=A0A9X1QPH3_9CORY|nr:DUF2993 domain-containing protein [Corynebacterium uropygiale]